MDLVLYEPKHGYYTSRAIAIGPQGDFFTSPHLGTDFGELLAEQFLQMWEILKRPMPFTLLELGAGQGLLATDILGYLYRYHPDFYAALDYIIVERSDTLRREQRRRLGRREQGEQGEQETVFLPVRWKTLEEIPIDSIVGCCFSNELVDALPVHQIIVEGGQLREIYVTTGLVEVIGELSTQRLSEYFDLIGIELSSSAYPSGYRSEVNLAALDGQRAIAERLQRGYLLTIDYGYPSTRYYSPARIHGTLQCYHRHQRHDNPYINIGRQDITAHIDFTALELWGELCRLHKIGFTQQGLFLMALGLGERLVALSTSNTASSKQDLALLLRRREALHQLMNPLGLGGFGVLLQCRGLTEVEMAYPLKGLSIPAS
ncbi:MAG: SAM-dependent methyltransferase [Chroococcidiopsidaceae cyanobacterium CP_BM_RX_35]|nr:SAM-dependent methyltransferase [Chroococcidiopsidaceae cyanobacterium CP_BM_RX_35]